MGQAVTFYLRSWWELLLSCVFQFIFYMLYILCNILMSKRINYSFKLVKGCILYLNICLYAYGFGIWTWTYIFIFSLDFKIRYLNIATNSRYKLCYWSSEWNLCLYSHKQSLPWYVLFRGGWFIWLFLVYFRLNMWTFKIEHMYQYLHCLSWKSFCRTLVSLICLTLSDNLIFMYMYNITS